MMSEVNAQLALQIAAMRTRTQELGDNRANLTAIADWCAVTYVTPGEDRKDTLLRIQEYLKDAMLTVTQQIAMSGATLSACLEQQALELQSLDAMVRLIENRLASQKEQLARTAMLSQFMRKLPAPRVDSVAAVEPAAHAQMPTVFRTPAGTIDFEALGSLGRHARLQSAARPPPPPPPPSGDSA